MCDLQKLRVCFIAGSLGQGGAERQLFYILQALQRSGAAVRVLCLTTGEFWEDRLLNIGVPVTWVGRPASPWLRLQGIVEELQKHPADVVQSQHFFTTAYACAAGRLLGIPEVGAIRGDVLSELDGKYALARRICLWSAKVVAANSRAAIRAAAQLGVNRSRLHFLPNVVDAGQFQPAARREPGPVRILAAGRLVAQKRYDRLLSVLARVRREPVPEFRATIIGSGPLQSQLERQAAELGLLPDVVTFQGTVPNMAGAYRDADILLLTSDHEGTPNVLLEAMASGLPVVATQVGDVPEIVQHGETGYLGAIGNDSALVESVVRLLNNPDLRMRMGRLARRRVEEQHAPDRLPQFLKDLYQAALS